MIDFWENVTKKLEEQGKRKNDLANFLQTYPSTIHKWIKNDRYPSAEKAEKIADYLNTSVKGLMLGEELFDPAEMYIRKNPELRSLVIKLGLHPELITRVDAYLEGYMESHGYTDLEAAEGGGNYNAG